VGVYESDDEHHRYGGPINRLSDAHKKAAYRRIFGQGIIKPRKAK